MILLRLLPVLCLAVLLASCASRQETPAYGASEEWRLRSLEENFLAFKEGQKAQEDRVREMGDRIDQRFGSVEDRLAHIEDALAILEARPGPMSAPPAKAPAPEGKAMNGKGGSGKGAEGKAAAEARASDAEVKPWMEEPGQAPALSAPDPEAATGKPAPDKAGQALYEEGVRLANADKPEQARAVLGRYLAENPKGAYAPNALYWTGETYYDQQNYTQAILSFKEVTRLYPKHDKAPASLLKIGMAYMKLGDKDNASFNLKALVDEYPNSDPAGLARKRLSELGG